MIEERLRFVARRLAGEPMAEPCRKFGTSRTPGDWNSLKTFREDCWHVSTANRLSARIPAQRAKISL